MLGSRFIDWGVEVVGDPQMAWERFFKFKVVAGTQFLRKIYKIGFIGTTFTYKLFVSIFKGNNCESGMKLLIKRSLDITLVVEGLKVKSPKSVKKV